ncbi:HU family DNA-binding protein [Psychrobacter celer]|uniref:HU family DNA-binding protein n=1 Tax=Psychrobacter celer TaxID=306572 RepID=UPI003FD161F3
MNKQELVKKIAKASHRTDASAETALQIVLDGIAEALADGETVKLVGFGTFKTTERDAHTARNPATGEEVQVPAKTHVSFVAGKSLKEAVN